VVKGEEKDEKMSQWHIVHGLQVVLSESIFAGTVWSDLKVSLASAGDKAGAEEVSRIIIFVSTANGQEARSTEQEIWLLYSSLIFSK